MFFKGLKTDPPLLPLFKGNTYIVDREVRFQVFLPRDDSSEMDISVDYGDKSSDILTLKSMYTLIKYKNRCMEIHDITNMDTLFISYKLFKFIILKTAF